MSRITVIYNEIFPTIADNYKEDFWTKKEAYDLLCEYRDKALELGDDPKIEELYGKYKKIICE